MKKKVLGIILMAVLTLSGMAGCSTESSVDSGDAAENQETEAEKTEGKGKYKVCFVTPTVADNPSYIKIIDLAQQEADKAGGGSSKGLCTGGYGCGNQSVFC